ncbi:MULTISPECIES: fimbrial assembly protein [Exiguobacterium]|uniref:fimbrial assembly protein n=1 Tax=Exiguobacterium TaxID=33986 RepID=UPI001AE6F2A1|nr:MULTISPECIES: fimbrial assembly protein [Exiguobacterium]MCT4778755.1 fimbrial assembly protein [Exiguobacterium soli]
MAQARRRGTYIYFNFTDVGIFGAVVKKGVIKRRAVVSLPPGTLQGGWLQPEASFDLIFESLLAKLKVPRGSQAVLAMDGSLVLARKLEIPETVETNQIRGYLFMELGHSIVLPFEEPYFDYTLLEENGKREIMLYAAPNEALKQYMELFKQKRLRLVAAEPQPLATFFGLDSLYEVEADSNLLIWNVNATNHQLIIIEDKVPRLIRSVDTFVANAWDVDVIDDRLHYRYKSDDANVEFILEEMLLEFSRVLDFYRFSLARDGREISRVMLTGDFPFQEELVRRFEANFDVRLEQVPEVLDVVSQPIPKSYLPLVGLATIHKDRINLLPDSDVAPKFPLVASLILLVFGGMIGGYLYWQTDQFADRIETANNQIQIVRTLQSESAQSAKQEVAQLKETVEGLEATPRPAVPALERITRYLPERGYILQFAYGADHLVTMNAQFETLDELNGFYRQLLTDTAFTGITLTSVTTKTMNEEAEVVTSTTVDPTTGEEVPTTTITPSDETETEEPRYIGQFGLTIVPAEVIKGETNQADPDAPKEDGTTDSTTDPEANPTEEVDPATEPEPGEVVSTEVEEVEEN